MQSKRLVRLFRIGCDQVLRIPREFELEGDEAMIRKVGDRLIIEPVVKPDRLRELFASWELLDEALPGAMKIVSKCPIQSDPIFVPVFQMLDLS